MKLTAIAGFVLPVFVTVFTLAAAPALAETHAQSSDQQKFQQQFIPGLVIPNDLLFVSKVVQFNPGKGIKELQPTDGHFYRQNVNNALGKPQFDPTNSSEINKNFLSLGLGGSAIFEFGKNFLSEVTVWETTWGRKTKQDDYDERVEVFVGKDLHNWISLGIIKNIADGAFNKIEGATIASKDQDKYKYVKLVDVSPTGTKSDDGFDVNAIAVKSVQSVPEPASVLGLLAFGAIGINSIRKRK